MVYLETFGSDFFDGITVNKKYPGYVSENCLLIDSSASG